MTANSKIEYPIVKFAIPADREYGTHVYEPTSYGRDAPAWAARYSVPVFEPDLEYALNALDESYLTTEFSFNRRHDRAVAWAKSNNPPEVIVGGLRTATGSNWRGDLDKLVRELARLDARNVPRDAVFNGLSLKCTAAILPLPNIAFASSWHDRNPGVKYALAIRTVQVNPQKEWL